MEGLECEVRVDGIRLEPDSEFKYLVCILEESGTDEADCRRKGVSGRRIAGAIRFLNTRDLQRECASLAWKIVCICSYVWQ